MKIKPPAIYRIIERKSPISEEYRGDYLQCAAPNYAALDRRGRAIPSFQKPWALEPEHLVLDPKDVDRLLTQFAESYEIRPV